MIWFSWQVSERGYRYTDGALIANSVGTARALACLREEFAERICLEFADLECVPDKICDFADRFGLLRSFSARPEPISIWKEEINSIREVLSMAASGNTPLTAVKYAEGWERQTGVEAAFLPNVDKSDLEFRCIPHDFASWLWLQVGHILCERTVGRCRQCDNIFFKGGGKGRRRTQSRSTKRFCSIECKIFFNNSISKIKRLAK